MPASAIALVSMVSSGIIGGFVSRRYRLFLACLYLLPTIAGNCILWKGDRENKALLLAGLYMIGYPFL
ncbi:hypothetical protein BDV12DRAFT_177421 [Aspergillus spectabilis]